LTDTGHIVIRHRGEVEADIPLAPLADQAPVYHRPTAPAQKPLPMEPIIDPVGTEQALLRLIGCPDLASRAWVYNQYDSTVGGQTVRRPGAADAAIVKVEDTQIGLALTTDCTPRYCRADARLGGAQAVAEAWRNITATGARPLAVTDNLNFGSPEKPEVMGQFVDAIAGMGEACRALDFPVVSGNVSLYNETRAPDGTSQSILPTPAIGGLGVLEDVRKAVGLEMPEGCDVMLLGETKGQLGQSIWLREILGAQDGAPPTLDLAAERRNGDFVRGLILDGTVIACHDVADGGVLVAVAEMVMAGQAGCVLDAPQSGMRPEAFWFGEDQSRYIVAVRDGAALATLAGKAGVPCRRLGHSAGGGLTLPNGSTISRARLCAVHSEFFPRLMDR
ncbi:AIR synthase related protein, partial [Komagataeibacter rhaeticus]|uniref:AIR synthase related protein n=1 Tax=Komagataeibacter rhaeticus TaxID=215221 RepID=UPI0039ED88D7